VKRWVVAFVVVVLACVPIFLSRSSDPGLLTDSDTSVLIKALNVRHAPLSWFGGDWPLENHFYRPVSTLSFEFDNAVHPNNPGGFGLTNVSLVIGCVFLLFWFLREITDSPLVSCLSASLFSFWVCGKYFGALSAGLGYLSDFAAVILIGSLILFLVRKVERKPAGDQWKRALLAASAALLLYYAAFEVEASGVTVMLSQLPWRMLLWLPGRTASVMTLFALLAMASYARYERISAERAPAEATSTDVPATKGTVLVGKPRFAWIWCVLACLGVALALGSYEQAVMLPTALVGVAVSLKLRRYRVRWAWHAAFWLILVLYLVLRNQLLPHGVSQYQRQQFRHSGAVIEAIMGYAFPALMPLWHVIAASGSVIELLSVGQFWTAVLRIVADISSSVTVIRKRFALALTGYALSVLAFLPMAWLKPFGHYDFWPMAMRSLFTVTLCWVAIERLINAVSPLSLQAPPRQSPAPGSLPHP